MPQPRCEEAWPAHCKPPWALYRVAASCCAADAAKRTYAKLTWTYAALVLRVQSIVPPLAASCCAADAAIMRAQTIVPPLQLPAAQPTLQQNGGTIFSTPCSFLLRSRCCQNEGTIFSTSLQLPVAQPMLQHNEGTNLVPPAASCCVADATTMRVQSLAPPCSFLLRSRCCNKMGCNL
jgi:hypothetical protein